MQSAWDLVLLNKFKNTQKIFSGFGVWGVADKQANVNENMVIHDVDDQFRLLLAVALCMV